MTHILIARHGAIATSNVPMETVQIEIVMWMLKMMMVLSEIRDLTVFVVM